MLPLKGLFLFHVNKWMNTRLRYERLSELGQIKVHKKIYLHISIFAYFRKYWQEMMSWGNNWTLSSIKFKLWKNRYQYMEKFDEVDWSLALLYLLSTLSRQLMSWPSVLYCVFLQLEGFFTKRGSLHLTETNSDYYF